VPSKKDPFKLFVETIIICFSVQRITRYPLLIKQILQYTEPDQDRELTERALHTAERILNTINEAIREQDGRERLRTLSQDLWIGQGCVPRVGYTRAYLRFLQGGWI
jgi:hypothetical protein